MTEVVETKEKEVYKRILLLSNLTDSYYESKINIKIIIKIIKYEKENFKRLNFPFSFKTREQIMEKLEELLEIVKTFLKAKELSTYSRNVKKLKELILLLESKTKDNKIPSIINKVAQSGEGIIKQGIQNGFEKLKTFASENVEKVKKNLSKKES